jgi:hypothetical protein
LRAGSWPAKLNGKSQNWEGDLPEVINFWEQLTGRRYDMTTVALEYRWTKAAAAAWSNVATFVL